MTVTRQQIVDAARSYIGVRYHHQGRSRAGLDCAGLLVCVARDIGLDTSEDLTGYARTPDGVALKTTLGRALREIPIFAYSPGDVLLMRFERDPQHVAIVTDCGIIHSYLSARKVVEHRIDDVWRARILAAYELPGVAS